MSDDLSIPNPGYRGNRAGRYGTGQGNERPGMHRDTRRLVIFAGALGAVLVLLISVSSLIGHRSGDVPVITADPRPVRIKPDNPGGMKIDGAENDVFSGGADTSNARLAPPAENPDTKGLHTTAIAPPPPVAAPAPVAVAPAPVTLTPPAVTKPPLTKPPVTKPQISASADPGKAAAAKPPPPIVLDARPAPGGAHPAMVQLAAVASEEGARNEWQLLSKRMPDLLNGRQPVFSHVERDGHTYWRVRTAGFADLAQARSFCDHVRTKGGGCTVADF